MPKRLSKIDPLDIDELFNSPSLKGMLSFRNVDSATAAIRLKAKISIDENRPRAEPQGNETTISPPLIVTPTAFSPIDLLPTGAGEIFDDNSQILRKIGKEVADHPVSVIPIGGTTLLPGAPAQDLVLSPADIMAEVQDVSRLVRSRGKILRASKVEDGHSGNENSLYWYLWRCGRQIQNSKSRFVQIGYAMISKGVGLDRTNVQNILRTLEAKLAIRVVTPGTVKSSTVYEIFSCEQVLVKRREAGLLWVQRYGSRRVDFVDDTGNPFTPTDLTPTRSAPRVGVRQTPSVGAGHAEPVGTTPTQLVKKEIDKQTSSPSPFILQALNQYGTADDDVVHKLIQACRAEAVDCTGAEIVHFIHQKAALVHTGRITNPLGFLLTAVPKCFTGHAFALYRSEERKRQEEEKVRQKHLEAESQHWKSEQEAVLADPNASDDDKRFAKQLLGIN